MSLIMVYIPCKDREEADKISKHLLEKKLVACSGLWPVTSQYFWKGNFINNEKETIIFAKSVKEKREQIIEEVKKLHSYELPCIEFFETSANQDYEDWVKEEVK